MFAGMCGIMPDEKEPGFTHFVLRPTPDMRSTGEIPAGQHKVTEAHASYDFRGDGSIIRSGWELVDGKWVYDFSVPSGTSARVELPAPGVADAVISINGLDFTLDSLGGKLEGDRAVFELQSGDYTVSLAD